MSIPTKLAKFLKRHKVHYEIQVHSETFTSSETAQAEHISGKKLAKVVMVKADEKNVMVVIPSNRTVDLFKLTAALGTNNVRIEEEKEFRDLFPDCQSGAMPPIGKIYGLPCYVDQTLCDEDEIYFNAGNHVETLKVYAQDFLKLSETIVGDFSVLGKKVVA